MTPNIISFSKLSLNDQNEIARLSSSCTTIGCFYIDFRHPNVDDQSKQSLMSCLTVVREVYEIMDQFYALPLELKMEWEMNKWHFMKIGGYKPVGYHSGVVRGKRDGFENFMVPIDALLNNSLNNQKPWPQPIQDHLDTLRPLQSTCQAVMSVILAALSTQRPPVIQTAFEDHHRPDYASTSTLAMLNYLPQTTLTQQQIGHMAHTDVGSLTLLFSDAPGLEVFDEASSSWLSLLPRPGCAIVNVGDTLSFQSRMKLKSCLHRVVPVGSSDGRKSVAFFLRPELGARFSDNEGKEWTGREWHAIKYNIFRADNREQETSSLLTGRTGFLGDLIKSG